MYHDLAWMYQIRKMRIHTRCGSLFYACNPSTREAKIRGLWVQDQNRPYSKIKLNSKILSFCRPDGFSGEGAWHQTWRLEFGSQDPHGGNYGTLSSDLHMWAVAQMHVDTYVHTYT